MFKSFWNWRPFHKPVKKPQVTKRNKLSLRMKDNYVQTYWVDDWESNNKITPWIPFYKWYFGREQSKIFRFQYKEGENITKREDIITFNIYIENVEI